MSPRLPLFFIRWRRGYGEEEFHCQPNCAWYANGEEIKDFEEMHLNIRFKFSEVSHSGSVLLDLNNSHS